MERIRERPSLPSEGVLRPTSSFSQLAELWLADLELRDLASNTKENYRGCLQLHVRPAFDHYNLAEITTGRVEWFLARQGKNSPSQARQARTMLNLLFSYALRHDAISRNPVEGTSPLRKKKAAPQALTLEQISAIRVAAATWRTEAGLPGPKPDGQVRDIIEVRYHAEFVGLSGCQQLIDAFSRLGISGVWRNAIADLDWWNLFDVRYHQQLTAALQARSVDDAKKLIYEHNEDVKRMVGGIISKQGGHL